QSIYGPGAPVVVPPRPTRRSSDLSRAHQAMLSKAREQAEDASSNKTRMLVAAGEEVGALAETIVSALEELEMLAHFRHQKSKVRDRKSTRLNSSHVKISYAVFCLK